ncbi:MAG TPA: hypothetical protein VER55_13320, partial [Ardenticatenaceae bacterium]|nr:hypothetical protein [Ardenticatenaceae bacterium]
RRDEHPRVYTHIVVRYVITGHHLDPRAVARAVELSETKYCSVAGMLGTACDLTTMYEIREAADQAV